MTRSRHVTRGANSSATATLASELTTQPLALVLMVLRSDAGALGASAIKQRLMDRGVDEKAAKNAWDRAQPKIRYHDQVVFDANTYRWTATPRVVSAQEALHRIARGGEAAKRATLVAIIRAALHSANAGPGPELAGLRAELADARAELADLRTELADLRAELADARAKLAGAEERAASLEGQVEKLTVKPEVVARPEAAQTPQDEYERAQRRRAARERQARIDAISAVAELAADVEELTARAASAQVLLAHTRSLTGNAGLEAIGRVGEPTPFDESYHDPVGDFPEAAAAVIVIRPGYLWHAPGEDVLISKALIKRA